MSFDKQDILSISLEGGEMVCTFGNASTNEGQGVGSFWGLDGFYSRPKPPDSDGACMGLYARQGHTARIIATKDNRIVAKYGELGDGDRAIVGYGSARILMKDASDSVSLMTENHASQDELMIMQLNGERGELTIILGGPNGAAMLKLTPDVLHVSVAGGQASLTLDKDGFHVTGNTCDLATAGGNLGVLGAIPPPPGANSVLKGVQGQVGTPSTFWTVA